MGINSPAFIQIPEQTFESCLELCAGEYSFTCIAIDVDPHATCYIIREIYPPNVPISS